MPTSEVDSRIWWPLKDYAPEIGATIRVRHYGYRPPHQHIEHRAIVYRGEDGQPAPRPTADYMGFFSVDTMTHWCVIETPSD